MQDPPARAWPATSVRRGAVRALLEPARGHRGGARGEHLRGTRCRQGRQRRSDAGARAFVDESDTTAPETALEAIPADPSLAEEAVFGFTGTDDLTPLVLLAFECRLDPNELTPWVLCRSPESLTGNPLAIGLHTFEVRAVDLAGNVDPSPAMFVWEVMAPPDTIIDSGPEDSDSADVVFTFSSDQQPSTFECAVDAALFEPCTSPHELIDVPVGDHVLAVRATNVHGLTDVTRPPRIHGRSRRT